MIATRYRPDRLWYADDVFAIHKRGRSTYARELQRRRLRLPFECISRAERIDDDVADALVRAGLLARLDRLGERIAAHARRDAAARRRRSRRPMPPALLHRRGIQVGMFIMLGYDGERDERPARDDCSI